MEIDKEQEETADALARVYQHGSVSFSGVYPINEALKRAEVGAPLSISELLDVAKLLKVAENARQYGDKAESKDEEGVTGRQDSLTGYFDSLMPLAHLSKRDRTDVFCPRMRLQMMHHRHLKISDGI